MSVQAHQRSNWIVAAFVVLACLCFAPAIATWLIGVWVVLGDLNLNCLSPAAPHLALGAAIACSDTDANPEQLAALGLAPFGLVGVALLVGSIWRGFGGGGRVALMSAFLAAGFASIALASPGLFRWGIGGAEIFLALLPALGVTALLVLAAAMRDSNRRQP